MGTPSKKEFFDKVVAELNLDTTDAFTLLLANACALVDQRDALKTELDAAKRALAEFGKHDPTCEYVATDSVDHPNCDCGFAAALAAKSTEQKEE